MILPPLLVAAAAATHQVITISSAQITDLEENTPTHDLGVAIRQVHDVLTAFPLLAALAIEKLGR